MKRTKTYTEYFATRNYEFVEEFIEELREDGIEPTAIFKTGEGWGVEWVE